MSGTEESRKAQDYTFEALHRVYFYDAWRPEPILDVPGSELVLPPESGLLVQGCYWPQPRAVDDILSVSDADTEDAEHPSHSPASPTTTDATMEAGEANSLASVPSSPTGRLTVTALAIALPPPIFDKKTMQWQMKVGRRAVPFRRREWTLQQTTPLPIYRSLQTNGGQQLS